MKSFFSPEQSQGSHEDGYDTLRKKTVDMAVNLLAIALQKMGYGLETVDVAKEKVLSVGQPEAEIRDSLSTERPATAYQNPTDLILAAQQSVYEAHGAVNTVPADVAFNLQSDQPLEPSRRPVDPIINSTKRGRLVRFFAGLTKTGLDDRIENASADGPGNYTLTS